jgi:hypothetical protein
LQNTKSTTTDVLSAEPVYKENKHHDSEIEQLGLLVKEKDDHDSEQIERSKARTMVLLRISAILIIFVVAMIRFPPSKVTTKLQVSGFS